MRVAGGDYTGGLVGWSEGSGHVVYCMAIGSVQGRNGTGGLAGNARDNIHFSTCGAWADVTGLISAGGLIGHTVHSVTDCFAAGKVTGTGNVGGLAGTNWGEVSGCWTAVAVRNVSDGANTGGLVGRNFGVVRRCFAIGSVEALGAPLTGGIVGHNDQALTENCFATGPVAGADLAGGGLGITMLDPASRCYSTGLVTGSGTLGGFIGHSYGTVRACFWDIETSGMATSGGGTGKSTADMKRRATFESAGWNFDSVWKIREDRTYPTLRGLPTPYEPCIQLRGPSSLDAECGEVFLDPGVLAFDVGLVPLSTQNTGEIAVAPQTGAYVLTYTALDGEGNPLQHEGQLVETTRMVRVSDSQPPVIILAGSGTLDVSCGSVFLEPGALAYDACDGDISANIIYGGDAVDTQTPEAYVRTYNVTDGSGFAALEAVRLVTVVDRTPPEIVLIGAPEIDVECGSLFDDPGGVASDECDDDVAVEVTGAIELGVPGEYVVTYDAVDAFGNAAVPVKRLVRIADTQPPVIELLGGAEFWVSCGKPFVDPGAVSVDACDPDVLVVASIGPGDVDTGHAGEFVVAYTAMDASGNAAESVRLVRVVDTEPPEITLLGDAHMTLYEGTPYIEWGATARDACDDDVFVSITGGVDTGTPGTYSLRYTARDEAGNWASTERTVTVLESLPGEGEGEEEGEGEGEGDACAGGWHTADRDHDNRILLIELLRVIQLYNSHGFHCADPSGDTEDGYAPGPGDDRACCPHDSDYSGGPDWSIGLTELFRLFQFYNAGGYYACPDADPPTEDGFCPGLGKE